MKFLIDEDVPVAILAFLRSLGHEADRVIPRSSDLEIAKRAKGEGRILLSLDKDFTNLTMFPPKEYNIVRVEIHPPTAPAIKEAIKKLLEISPKVLSGLIMLRKDGHVQYL